MTHKNTRASDSAEAIRCGCLGERCPGGCKAVDSVGRRDAIIMGPEGLLSRLNDNVDDPAESWTTNVGNLDLFEFDVKALCQFVKLTTYILLLLASSRGLPHVQWVFIKSVGSDTRPYILADGPSRLSYDSNYMIRLQFSGHKDWVLS
jgi:hypothetical protein